MAHTAFKDNLWINLGELGNPSAKPLLKTDSNAEYVPQNQYAGLLLFMDNGVLLGQQFDLRKEALLHEPRVIARSVEYHSGLKYGSFSASAAGTLAYRSAQPAQKHLRWFSRQGVPLDEVGEAGDVRHPYLSRDGTVLAVMRRDPATGGDIWTYDLNRGGVRRVTRHSAWESCPILSPDNKEIVFSSDRPPKNAYRKTLEGAIAERELVITGPPNRQRLPYDWSSDGKFILFTLVIEQNNEDLWLFQTDAQREFPLVQSSFSESQGQFSSDQRWVAYCSDETGRPEVYVRAFLPPDRLGEQRTPVSVDGGSQPRWRQDGKELFYVRAGRRIDGRRNGDWVRGPRRQASHPVPSKASDWFWMVLFLLVRGNRQWGQIPVGDRRPAGHCFTCDSGA